MIPLTPSARPLEHGCDHQTCLSKENIIVDFQSGNGQSQVPHSQVRRSLAVSFSSSPSVDREAGITRQLGWNGDGRQIEGRLIEIIVEVSEQAANVGREMLCYSSTERGDLLNGFGRVKALVTIYDWRMGRRV